MKTKNNQKPSVLRSCMESFLEILKSYDKSSTIAIDAVEEMLNDWEQTILSELDIIASSNVKADDDSNTEESDSV